MDLVARIEPGADTGSINLVGCSEVTMNGKAAAFGGRMMGTVADQILKQFAGNFAAQVQERAQAAKASDAGSVSAQGASTSAGEDTAAAVVPDATAKELNALSLVWAGLRAWFRGLFRRGAA